MVSWAPALVRRESRSEVLGLSVRRRAVFFGIVGTVYAIWSRDWIGGTALIFTGFMTALIAFYLLYTAKRLDNRPEDDMMANQDEAARTTGSSVRSPGGRFHGCQRHAHRVRPDLRHLAADRRNSLPHDQHHRARLRVLPRDFAH